ncbi:MAG: glycosyltransferase family 2 protein [Candidatus Magasanikbacteria bacterium]
MNEKLTILITNYNTSDFVGVSLRALQVLTDNKYVVLINDNGSTNGEIEKIICIAEKYDNVYLHFRKGKNEKANLAHGTALDVLMEQVKTPYTVVLDSDALILKKHWDTILIEFLDEKKPIIGSPRLTQDHHDNKVRDIDLFPFQFIVLFDTQVFKSLQISWKPDTKYTGFPVPPEHDTAWEVWDKFTKAGLRGKVFDAKNTRWFSAGPFRELTGVAEYYLDGSSLIGAHFGRGSFLGKAKYKKGFYKYFYSLPLFGNFFVKYRGKHEVQRWITICNNIINKQKDI